MPAYFFLSTYLTFTNRASTASKELYLRIVNIRWFFC